MGRPQKTYEQHMLAGNPSKLSKNTLAQRESSDPTEKPSQVAAGRPKMPAHLSAEAVESWKLVCKLLRAKGTLAKTDAATLEIYCEVKSSWILAKRDVQERGQVIEETRYSKSGDSYTVRVVNPSVPIQRDSERQLLQLTKALGLSPDAREKVRRTRKVKSESDENTALMKAFPFLLEPKKEETDDEDL